MRFAAARNQNSAGWINAGAQGAKNVRDINSAVTSNSPDYGGMAQAWMNSESSKRVTGMKAAAQVTNAGIRANAKVEVNDAREASKKVERDRKIKSQMAGKLAAGAAAIIKGMDKPLPPVAPATIDIEALRELTEARNAANPRPTPQDPYAGIGDSPESADSPAPAAAETPAPAAPSGDTPTADTNTDGPITFEKVLAFAQNSGAQYPELVAAQWQLETGGTSGQGPTANNNIFAQKGGDFSSDTKEYVNGSLQAAPNQGWQSYESPQAATDWLVNNWYRDSEKHGQGAESLGGSLAGTAQALNTLNYATDPEYGNKLIKILRARGYQV